MAILICPNHGITIHDLGFSKVVVIQIENQIFMAHHYCFGNLNVEKRNHLKIIKLLKKRKGYS